MTLQYTVWIWNPALLTGLCALLNPTTCIRIWAAFKNRFEQIYFSLYQAPWKNLPENPSFPGFFMGRLFAYGYPSDTFVKLPVSKMRLFICITLAHLHFFVWFVWLILKSHLQLTNLSIFSYVLFSMLMQMHANVSGLGKRSCVYKWPKSRSLLVNWSSAGSLPPWTLSQQWNKPGMAIYRQPFIAAT